MASLFHLKIVTPQGNVFDNEIEGIILRTTEGDIGILKGHAGQVSAIKAGRVKVNTPDGVKYGAASEGFIRVNKEETRLVVTTFEWAEEIDVARAEKSLERAKAEIEAAETPEAAEVAKAKAKRARTRIETAEFKK